MIRNQISCSFHFFQNYAPAIFLNNNIQFLIHILPVYVTGYHVYNTNWAYNQKHKI